MARKITSDGITPEEDLRQRLWVQLQQEGGDPSALLELLCLIAIPPDSGPPVWERLGMTFTRFITTPYNKGGAGWSEGDVESVLDMKHRHERVNPPPEDKSTLERLAAMRKVIRPLVMKDKGAIPALGYNQHTDAGYDNIIPSNGQGTSADYTTRRLMRDRPELADAVLAGKMSANEAAIVAGFRKKKIQVYPDDPENTARLLVKHMTPEAIEELQVWLDKLA